MAYHPNGTLFVVCGNFAPTGAGEGSAALPLCCTTAHPPYTRFAIIIGASVSEAAMRPDSRPRRMGGGGGWTEPMPIKAKDGKY